MSNSIDKDEMRSVLITFSIELTEGQIEDLMDDFGAKDEGNGLGKTIRYPEFVKAVETITSLHPLQMSTGRIMPGLKARVLQDMTGRRLTTPGFRAPVGCPDGGCYFAPETRYPLRNGRHSSMF